MGNHPTNTAAEESGGRTTISAHTAAMEPCTVVVVRYGIGPRARVALSWRGEWQRTAVLTLEQAGDLEDALCKARWYEAPHPV